jgi:hypothetical protein
MSKLSRTTDPQKTASVDFYAATSFCIPISKIFTDLSADPETTYP